MRNNAGNSEEINVVYLKVLEIYDARRTMDNTL